MQRLQAMKLPGVRLSPNSLVFFVDEVKNLGVILDSKLTCKPQMNLVTKKVNRALYGLRFIKNCLTEELRKRLVMTLVTAVSYT